MRCAWRVLPPLAGAPHPSGAGMLVSTANHEGVCLLPLTHPLVPPAGTPLRHLSVVCALPAAPVTLSPAASSPGWPPGCFCAHSTARPLSAGARRGESSQGQSCSPEALVVSTQDQACQNARTPPDHSAQSRCVPRVYGQWGALQLAARQTGAKAGRACRGHRRSKRQLPAISLFPRAQACAASAAPFPQAPAPPRAHPPPLATLQAHVHIRAWAL